MDSIDLSRINPYTYRKKKITSEEVLGWFKNEDAYWAYEGEPSPDKPHAELTSGVCSDGFFDCLRVLRYPNIAEILGYQAAMRVLPLFSPSNGDWVISSAYAAITFGHEVAKALGIIFMNTEKDPENPKKQLWHRMIIPAEACVLQAEELVTTSSTFQEVLRAVEEGNEVKPVSHYSPVVALIHRPPKLSVEYNGRMVVAVVEKAINNYDPRDCPYCAVGSTRYRPKTHWAELTGKK
ncbi:MAG: hypothetical protein ABH831_02680 [Candidatus Nealsonbacteria bacterium]